MHNLSPCTTTEQFAECVRDVMVSTWLLLNRLKVDLLGSGEYYTVPPDS